MYRRKDLLDVFNECFVAKNAMPEGYENWSIEKHIQLLEKMHNYYGINDSETGCSHGEIFAALYLSNENLLYDAIAARVYINVYTLDRYRQRYNRLAKKLIDIEIK